MNRIRVLLADDHPAMLKTITAALTPEFDVVGTVHDGLGAITTAAALAPDVVVLDLSMPMLSGIEVAHKLTARGKAPAIVILTVHEDPELVGEAFGAGAQGFVVKSRLASDLPTAIKDVHHGGFFISPSIRYPQ